MKIAHKHKHTIRAFYRHVSIFFWHQSLCTSTRWFFFHSQKQWPRQVLYLLSMYFLINYRTLYITVWELHVCHQHPEFTYSFCLSAAGKHVSDGCVSYRCHYKTCVMCVCIYTTWWHMSTHLHNTEIDDFSSLAKNEDKWASVTFYLQIVQNFSCTERCTMQFLRRYFELYYFLEICIKLFILNDGTICFNIGEIDWSFAEIQCAPRHMKQRKILIKMSKFHLKLLNQNEYVQKPLLLLFIDQ